MEKTVGAVLVLLSLSHWFPLGIHLFELLGAFAHFTLFIATVLLVVSGINRLKVLAVSSLTSAVLCAFLVVPYMVPLPSEALPELTVGQFNLYHHNPTPEKAMQAIGSARPDVFTVQELSSEWTGLLSEYFHDSHPFQVTVPHSDCCYGIGLYSSFPILSYEVIDVEHTPVIVARIGLKGDTLHVISVHTRPPVFPDQTTERNRQLERVAEMTDVLSTPLLVVGDLNIVPWDAVFRAFLSESNLSTARDGLQPTYPMEMGIPLIPIDHILHSNDLCPVRSTTVGLPGSDHRGLVVGFTFCN